MTFWSIILSIIIGLTVNEFCELSPWAARKLVRWSAYLQYRDPCRAEIRAEELSTLIDDRPGKLFKLITALGFAMAAARVAMSRAAAEFLAGFDSYMLNSGGPAGILKSISTAAITIAFCSVFATYAFEHPDSSSPPLSSSQALVSWRAAMPTDIAAPGIQMPAKSQFTIGMGSSKINITGYDWDTITSASRVLPLIAVRFAPGFNNSPTTRNRFQYLADLIATRESSNSFDPIGLATGFGGKSVTTIIALYNAGNKAGTLTGLKLRVIAQQSAKLLGSCGFFASSDSSLLVPSRTVVFARLVCPMMAQPRVANGAWKVADQFHYDNFAPI